MNRILYFFKEAVRALVEAKMMTFVSILTVGITLFFLTIAYLSLHNLNLWVDHYKHQTSIVGYLQLDLSEAEQSSLFKKVSTFPEVDEATFISRGKAYQIFSSLYGKELLSAVEENPFPASIEIDPNDNFTMDLLEKKLNMTPGIESVSVSKEWLSAFQTFRKYLRGGVAALIVIMILALYYTITNTIKLTVYARRDLVINMQYVGATRWYISTPFVLEGIIQGISGAFIAWCGVEVISLVLARFSLYWGGLTLLPVMITIGATLGLMGSLDAVRKFVR